MVSCHECELNFDFPVKYDVFASHVDYSSAQKHVKIFLALIRLVQLRTKFIKYFKNRLIRFKTRCNKIKKMARIIIFKRCKTKCIYMHNDAN